MRAVEHAAGPLCDPDRLDACPGKSAMPVSRPGFGRLSWICPYVGSRREIRVTARQGLAEAIDTLRALINTNLDKLLLAGDVWKSRRSSSNILRKSMTGHCRASAGNVSHS